MRRTAVVFPFLICLLFVFSNLTGAEETPQSILTMEELSIQLMPEYSYHPDDKEEGHPPLLVGIQGTLLNQSDQPQKGHIEIPLPMKAKDFRIGFVADYSRNQSEMNEIEYELNKDKGTILWSTSEEVQPGELYKFVIEYYTNDLQVDQNDRSLTYKFESFADIGLVRILFLEPLKAENFRLTPAAESHQENGYGMNMFMYQIQGMKPYDTKEFHLEYKRSETKTTMDIMNEMGGKTAAQEPLKENKPPSLGVMLGEVGGISGALAIGLFTFLKKRTKQKTAVNNPGEMSFGRVEEEYETKRKQLRGMLLQGTINEDEYQELLGKLPKFQSVRKRGKYI